MVNVSFELVKPDVLRPFLGPSTDGESLATLADIAIIGSRTLSAAGFDFVVRGLGRERWPTDVSYDFALVLEQLPATIDALESGARAELGFYGQGIERVLRLNPSESGVLVVSEPLLPESPEDYPSVQLNLPELLGQLRSLVRGFIDGVSQVAPALLEAPGISELERVAE